jgi:hypothetical protein
MMAASQFLRDGMFQFLTRFRIDPAADDQFDDRISRSGERSTTRSSLDADVHGQSASTNRQ